MSSTECQSDSDSFSRSEFIVKNANGSIGSGGGAHEIEYAEHENIDPSRDEYIEIQSQFSESTTGVELPVLTVAQDYEYIQQEPKPPIMDPTTSEHDVKLYKDIIEQDENGSMLDSVAEVSIGGIIETMFRESEEFVLIYSKVSDELPQDFKCPCTNSTLRNSIFREQIELLKTPVMTESVTKDTEWLSYPDNPEPESPIEDTTQSTLGIPVVPVPTFEYKSADPIEVDIHFQGKQFHSYAFCESRSTSEVRIFQEERREFEQNNLVSDSVDSLAEQFIKNRHLISKLAPAQAHFLQQFADMTDKFLCKIDVVAAEIRGSQNIMAADVLGKSTDSYPVLDLWSCILKMSMSNLRPPTSRKKETKFFVKSRLKEILVQLQIMSEITTNIAVQTHAAQITIIQRMTANWRTRFRNDVWTAVNKEEYHKLLVPNTAVGAESIVAQINREVVGHGSPVTVMKSDQPDLGNEFTVQLMWTEWSGLIVSNLGEPPVPYKKFNFLDRRTIFNYMIKEVLSLLKRALLKINNVALLTKFGGHYQNTQCQLELNLKEIDRILQKKGNALFYPLEALMVNQLRKIEKRFDLLVNCCAKVNGFFMDKCNDVETFYRKRKKIYKGKSKKAKIKMAGVISELQEVTLNFLIPNESIDFHAYANINTKDYSVQSVISSWASSSSNSVTNCDLETISQMTECSTPKRRTIHYNDSLAHLLIINEIGPSEICLCSEEVQNFHSYCCDAITFFKRGVQNLGILQYSLFAPIQHTSSELDCDLVYITGWLWIITKGIEYLLEKNTTGDFHQISQGVLAMVSQYKQICKGVNSFQKLMMKLNTKTHNIHDTLRKLNRESRIRLQMSHRTFISYGTRGRVGTACKIKLEEHDIRLSLTTQGIRIELSDQQIQFNELPLEKCLEILKILMHHANSEVKNANQAAFRVQQLKCCMGKESHDILQWELYKMQKFLRRVNGKKIQISEYEDDILAGVVQSLMKELSRFQELVQYLAQKSTVVCGDMKNLEKPLMKLSGEMLSQRQTIPVGKFRNFLLNYRKDSSEIIDGLKVDLQIIMPIFLFVKNAKQIKKRIVGLALNTTGENINQISSDRENEFFVQSDFLRDFLQKTNEMKTMISAAIITTGQDLHLPNSAVEPGKFQVSKIEALCAIIANGVLELSPLHSHRGELKLSESAQDFAYDNRLFEQVSNLMKESENLEKIANSVLEEKHLQNLKLNIGKLKEALKFGIIHETFAPHLFWCTVVKRNSEFLFPEPESSRLVISWQTREGGLKLACTNSKIEPTSFSTLSRDKRAKLILKMILIASDICRSTYNDIEVWAPELKLVEEMIKNLKKNLKLVKIEKYEEYSYTDMLSEITHEINVARACLENFRSTGKKMNTLMNATLNILKISYNNHHYAKIKPIMKLWDENQTNHDTVTPTKLLKPAANIKSAWFTSIKVEILIHICENKACPKFKGKS